MRSENPKCVDPPPPNRIEFPARIGRMRLTNITKSFIRSIFFQFPPLTTRAKLDHLLRLHDLLPDLLVACKGKG